MNAKEKECFSPRLQLCRAQQDTQKTDAGLMRECVDFIQHLIASNPKPAPDDLKNMTRRSPIDDDLAARIGALAMHLTTGESRHQFYEGRVHK